MAETQTAPTNKLVRFRGRAGKERTMAVPKHLRGRGLISEKASAAMTGPENAAKARAFQGHKLKPRSKAVGAKSRSGHKVVAAAK